MSGESRFAVLSLESERSSGLTISHAQPAPNRAPGDAAAVTRSLRPSTGPKPQALAPQHGRLALRGRRVVVGGGPERERGVFWVDGQPRAERAEQGTGRRSRGGPLLQGLERSKTPGAGGREALTEGLFGGHAGVRG